MSAAILSPRQVKACEAYYHSNETLTDAQIAEKFGVSRSAITHRRLSALKALASHPSAAVRRYAAALRQRDRRIAVRSLSICFGV